VQHSDRGVQYASGEYVRTLEKHHIIPSMSRPANPYDNASCESFFKTLKREEIYANPYQDLEHLRANIEEFIERYWVCPEFCVSAVSGFRLPLPKAEEFIVAVEPVGTVKKRERFVRRLFQAVVEIHKKSCRRPPCRFPQLRQFQQAFFLF
jgi:phosphoketolase